MRTLKGVPSEQLTVIPAGFEQATREWSQDKIVGKASAPQAQPVVAVLDKLLSTMTRANKAQRLKIWGTVCGFALNLSDDDRDDPSTRDPFVSVQVVGK